MPQRSAASRTGAEPPPQRATRKQAVRPVYYARAWGPDGGTPIPGLVLALLMTMAGGAFVGGLLGVLADAAYIVVVFPIIAGILLGTVGVFAVWFGHLRNPTIAATIGIIGGIVVVVVMHVVVHSRRVALDADQNRVSRDIVTFLVEEAEGPGIGALRRARPMLPLHVTGTWAARLADLVIICLIAMLLMRSQASEPYDPLVKMWKMRREVGLIHGTGQQVVGAFLSGRLDRVAALQHDRGQPVRVFAWGAAIHEPASTVEVELHQPEAGSSGQTEWVRLVRVSYPYRALHDIGQALQRKLPPMTRTAIKKGVRTTRKQTRKGITRRHIIKPALVPRTQTTKLLFKETTRVHRITSGRVHTVMLKRKVPVPQPIPHALPAGGEPSTPPPPPAPDPHNVVVPPPPPPAERPPAPGHGVVVPPPPPPVERPPSPTDD
ncbi:MAG: hypothetical protein AB7K09_10095 [Planctomycetota bacterium]